MKIFGTEFYNRVIQPLFIFLWSTYTIKATASKPKRLILEGTGCTRYTMMTTHLFTSLLSNNWTKNH